MAIQKKRKKISATVTDPAPNSETAIALLELPQQDAAQEISAEIARDALQGPQRPAWVDGAPVTSDGDFIREKYPQPRRFMRPADQTDEAPQEDSQDGDQQRGKNWGDPYKSIFNCREMGFELGENRRFKQRVFRFADKPTGEILDALKEHGFIYRPAEKAWTIQANTDTRKLTDELARQWAGPNYVRGIER